MRYLKTIRLIALLNYFLKKMLKFTANQMPYETKNFGSLEIQNNASKLVWLPKWLTSSEQEPISQTP